MTEQEARAEAWIRWDREQYDVPPAFASQKQLPSYSAGDAFYGGWDAALAWLASRSPVAAPSDTDRAALIARIQREMESYDPETLGDEQLDKIERRLSNANGLGLDEAVARHYREDVPALLAEVRSLRAQREAVLHTTNDRLTPKEGADLDMYEKGMRYGWEQAMKRVVRALGVTE